MIGEKMTVTKECKHQFFETCKGTYHSEDPRYNTGVFISIDNQPNGVIVMCALCGERRRLHLDGRVEILNKE